MLKGLFNKLVQIVPYGVTLSLFFSFWSAMLAFSFGAVLVISQADFEATNTGDLFLFNLAISVGAVLLYMFLSHGILRLVGSTLFEREKYKIINDSTKKGELKEDITNKELKKLFGVLQRLWFEELSVSSISVLFVLGFVLLGEYIGSGGDFINFFPMINGALISGFFAVIFAPLHTEILTSDIRRQVKKGMSSRGIEYKEEPFWSIRGKMTFIVFLVILLMLAQSLVLYPDFNLEFLIITSLGLIIISFLVELLTSSFYSGMSEIREAAWQLIKGKKNIFFSGSLDKELVELSNSLNETAKEVYESRKRLEEAEQVLKIRVRAKTRELKKLNENLEEKVEERTKKLQRRVEELEKFHNLTVGREKKMIELKKENKKLREKLQAYKNK